MKVNAFIIYSPKMEEYEVVSSSGYEVLGSTSSTGNKLGLSREECAMRALSNYIDLVSEVMGY